MDIRALRYFVELVREQSFTRASEKLFVTQPTISKMIRNMEEELGQPLLSRVGRRFTLTDSGQVLFNRAQTILAEMQQLEAELADLQSLQFGRLALGIPPMVGHVYADLIRAYRSRYPRVELSIVEYGGRRIEQGGAGRGAGSRHYHAADQGGGRPQCAGAGPVPDPGGAARPAALARLP